MKVMVPIPLTDAMLISSSVPENDYPVWVSGTTYTIGYRVIRPGIHSVFERNVAGAGTAPPEECLIGTVPVWLYVGKTNRWKAFDLASSAESVGGTDWTISIQPGTISGVALFGLSGSSVAISMTVSGVSVYSVTKPLLRSRATNWYEWLFGGIKPKTSVVLTDLPAYRLGILTVSISGTLPGCSAFCVGLVSFVGGTMRSPEFGITSFSVQKVDQWGVYTIKKRKNTRPLKFVLRVDNENLEVVTALLGELESIVCVWIGADDDRLKVLTVIGLYSDFSIAVPYLSYSDMSLKIQGI
jgi:hypothetical protein